MAGRGTPEGVSGRVFPPRDGEGGRAVDGWGRVSRGEDHPLRSGDAGPPPPRGGGKPGGSSEPGSKRRRERLEFARHLRKTMSDEEVILWSELRLLRHQGLHFRRKVPRDGYVLDFACLRARAIIEVDGEQHFHGSHPARDAARDRHFMAAGFVTLRYTTTDVRKHLNDVVNDIYLRVSARIAHPGN
nr:DUF559 domain-containing protein [Hoeflea marina]